MAYDLQTKSGIILRNIPDNVPEDAPELRAMAREANIAKLKKDNPGEYDTDSPEYAAKYGATSGMSGIDKVRANLGAGMSDVFQGAKQRYNEAFGSEEDAKRGREETRQKRVLDKTLAKDTTGGKYIQMAGSAVPLLATALVPGGQGIALNSAIGAGTGALSGYLQPTDEGESVGLNSLIGGTIGAVIPGTLSGLKKAYGWARDLGAGTGTARRASGRLAEQLGEGGEPLTREAAEQLAQQIEQQAGTQAGAQATQGATQAATQGAQGSGSMAQILGPGGTQNVAALQGQQAGRRIPLTVPAQTQNPQLARLEQASRQRNPDMWLEFDERQARAMAERLREATSEATEIASRKGARGAQYRASAEEFDAGVDPEAFRAGVERLRAANQTELAGPEAMNDTVNAALRSVEEKLGREGVELTPAHVRQLRIELASKLDPANPLRAAPRDNPAIAGMRNRFDEVLDEMGGGGYSPINQAYGEASRGVEAAQAAAKVRKAFYDPETGQAIKGASGFAGDVPTITEMGVQGAVNSTRNPAGVSTLSREARGGIDEVLEALRRQNLILRMKKTGSAGGGSDSAQNFTALAQEARRDALEGVAESVPGGRAAVRGVGAVDALINSRRDALVTQALQDPAQLANLLRMIRSASPEVERSVMQQLSSVGASMGERGGIAGATEAFSPERKR